MTERDDSVAHRFECLKLAAERLDGLEAIVCADWYFAFMYGASPEKITEMAVTTKTVMRKVADDGVDL